MNMSTGSHEEWLGLAKGEKGFRLWPRSQLEWVLSQKELHLPKVRSKWSKDLCRKPHITWAVKAETSKPVESSALLTASLSQYEAFLQAEKQRQGGPPATQVQLHHGLTHHEVLHCDSPHCLWCAIPQGQFYTEPSQKPFWKLEPGPSCKPVYWYSSEGQSEIICWERPHPI